MKSFAPHAAARTILMCWWCFSMSAPATELWISPTGNDSNPGTSSRPFASLAHAQTEARNLRLSRTNEPVTIVLRGGTYPIDAPIRLSSEDSAGQSGPLVVTAAPGEKPIVSGALEVGGWKLAGRISGLPNIARGKVWVATVPKVNGHYLEFRGLWVKDVKAVLAREPNGDQLTRLVAWSKTNQTATIPANALAGVEVPDRLEMIVDQVWEIAMLRVKSVAIHGTNAVLAFQQPESDLEFQHPWPPVIVNTNYQAPFFLANAIQFLNSSGEWFEDFGAGKVYYWPRTGEDLRHDEVFAPLLESLVEIEGTLDAPVSHVEFRGITFAHTTWLRSSEQGHVPLQAGMPMLAAKKLSPRGTSYAQKLDNLTWIDRPPGAVSLKDAEHISFEGCSFEHLASAGLDFQSGTHDDSVQGCTFRDIGGNGIQLGKFSDTNVETHFPYNPADEREICANETLANNLITDCANEDWGCVGIGVGYARGIKIEHNDVSNCSYTGISVGWGWTKMTNALRDNFIHANKVYYVATRMGDTAGIYTLSAQPGTVVSENTVDDISMSPYVPDSDHWYYLYLDEGSSFITVRDNWCPAEKFLKNANGPGNIWNNNGPQVSQKIRNAAGLEPAFINLRTK